MRLPVHPATPTISPAHPGCTPCCPWLTIVRGRMHSSVSSFTAIPRFFAAISWPRRLPLNNNATTEPPRRALSTVYYQARTDCLERPRPPWLTFATVVATITTDRQHVRCSSSSSSGGGSDNLYATAVLPSLCATRGCNATLLSRYERRDYPREHRRSCEMG